MEIAFQSSNIKENSDSEIFYKIGLMGVSWFGERIAILISGICSSFQTKHTLRFEVRSETSQIINTIKLNFERFVSDLLTDSNN
jgi:hypothetical protein